MNKTVILAILGTAVVLGQTPTLTYEVASIKPSGPDFRGTSIQIQPGGGLRVSGGTLKLLITLAYDVREFQVSGGPGWIDSEHYDIMAKTDHASASDPSQMTDDQRKTTQEQMRQRLQALLAERFQLTIHREKTEQSAYALVVARSGSKLQPAAVKEGERARPMMRMGRGQLSGQGVPLDMLVTSLSSQLGHPVLDRTGLTGNFDFTLEWTPDPGQPSGPPGADVHGPPVDPNGPSIFTAVQEQLGLRLESQKGLVEKIVVDRVERPSGN